MVTPMTNDYKVDEKGLRANIDWQIGKGVAGICVVGNTGEFSTLNKDERRLVAKVAVDHVKGRVPVIVGTSAPTTMEVIENTKYAEKIGADAAMIIVPYGAVPRQSEVIQFFKDVGEAVNIPIMLYNNPGVSAVDVLPETIAEIAKIKNITYVKESSGEIRRVKKIQELTGGSLKIFCGCEDLAFESFMLGAIGWICVAGNAVPAECQQLFDLTMAGKSAEALKVSKKILPLLEFLEESGKFVQVAKAAATKVSPAGGPCRPPRMPLTPAEDKKLVSVLRKMGALK